MRAYLTQPTEHERNFHRLFLEPQSEVDQLVLEELLEEYHCTNMGRRDDGRLLHVGIALKPLED